MILERGRQQNKPGRLGPDRDPGKISLARKLAALEKELKGRLDIHEATIVTILQRVMDILDPPPPLPPSSKPRRIGFRTRLQP